MIVDKIKNIDYLNQKINEFKINNRSCDIQLLEKTVGALYLVELLASSDIKFVFKGGTSLTILLDDIKRFSVDVDIITEMDEENVENILQKIVSESEFFTKLVIDERNNAASKRMKLKHYKFYFVSTTDQSDKYILLDVAFEKSIYVGLITKQLKCHALDIDSLSEVTLPTIESILGDKLTVLGPNTTGINFDSGKELEMIKQLYDVSNLFDEAKSINDIKRSFINIASRELQYRNLQDKTYVDVLDDIEEYCLNIVYLNDIEKINKLALGLRKAKGYILSKNYVLDVDGLLSASKILYLISLIRSNGEIKRYDDIFEKNSIDLGNIDISKQKRLKKIGQINKEALYYLVKYENESE